MKHFLKTLCAVLLIAAFSGTATVGILAANDPPDDAACYSNWSEAGPVLRAEKLMDPATVRVLAEKTLGGSLLRLTLCRGESDGTFNYRLVMIEAGGTVRSHTLDARKPF